MIFTKPREVTITCNTPLEIQFRYSANRLVYYYLHHWEKENKIRKAVKKKYSYKIGKKQEVRVRGLGHVAAFLAFMLYTGVFSEEISGCRKQDAAELSEQLIKILIKNHQVHSKKGWGFAWQSALWTADLALAIWFLGNKLSEETQLAGRDVIIAEANRFNNYVVPYQFDRNHKEIFIGDTKAEENSWNSSILQYAVEMLPEHPNVELWRKKEKELMLSAYISQSDMTSDKVVDGYKLSEFAQGYNIANDGTLINHSIVHPDYMVTVMRNVIQESISSFYSDKPLECARHNAELIYRALVDLDLAHFGKSGMTIYSRDSDNQPTCKINFPEGTDWGTARQANYFAFDMVADAFELDRHCSVKALEWARLRLDKIVEMQDRSDMGCVYLEEDDDKYKLRQEWVGLEYIIILHALAYKKTRKQLCNREFDGHKR